MFLTDEEILKLTGTRRRTAQIRWLAKAGWKFTCDYKGKPVIACAEVERQLVSGQPVKAKLEPNWDAVA